MSEKVAVVPVPTSTVKPGTLQRKCACGGTPGVSGLCPECERKLKGALQRKEAGATPAAVPSVVDSVLQSPGQPLDGATRSTMERGFGRDLGHVRVHTGAQAAESAQAVNAHAYTVGNSIAFDHGKYDPHSEGGQRLLAHEIAHTVQQGGLQRSAATTLEVSPAYSAAEAEADRVADAVVAGRSAPSISPLGPTLARTPTATVTTEPGPTPPITEPAPPSSPTANAPIPHASTLSSTPPEIDQTRLTAAGVTQIIEPTSGGGTALDRIFVVQEFVLPAEKGPLAKSVYDAMAEQSQLRATIDTRNRSSAVAQARDRSTTLRQSWIQKVGWSQSSAKANWIALGGTNPTSDFRPKAQNHTCHLDHIVELQVGGTNVRDNVQMLDGEPNVASGTGINRWLADKARAIKEAHTSNAPDVITMQFRSVSGGSADTAAGLAGYTGTAPSCIAAECKVVQGGLAGPNADVVPANTTPVRLNYGAQGTNAYVMAAGTTRFDNGDAVHRNTRQLVVGFLLNDYARGQEFDRINAQVDADRLTGRNETTRVQPTITEEPTPKFKATETGTTDGVPQKSLAFDGMVSNRMRFYYPLLSQGDMRLNYTPEGGFTGTGTLTPSVAFLRGTTLALTLGEGRLSAALTADVSRLRSIAGARITRAELAATLLPQFEAQGNLDLAFGRYATANLNITGGASGLEASGTLTANIPQVDNAQGQVRYRDGRWTGQIRISSTQIQIPSVQSANLVVDFDDQGVRPSGNIVLDVRGNPVNLGVRLEGGAWVFSGDATINVRHLDPVRLSFTYTRGRLTARGSTGFGWRDFRGTMAVQYEDGRFFGDGTLNVTRGPVSGTINAHLLRSGVITGDGTISYQVTPSLRATVGVAIDEAQNVRLTGELRFTQPLQLFRRFAYQRNLFHRNIDIPIAGVSLGVTSIGLVFRITGGLAVDFSVGPGEIRNLHLSAQFDPFAEQTNLSLAGGGQLYVPASAGFTASLRGALAVSAGIASVSGGLTASARVGINAEASSNLDFSYQNGRYVVDNVARLIARPVLDFRLEANVEAEVIGFDSYHEGYEIASYSLPSAMEFGVEAPFHYASDEPFHAPSLDDVRLIYPDLNVTEIMDGMLRRAGAM